MKSRPTRRYAVGLHVLGTVMILGGIVVGGVFYFFGLPHPGVATLTADQRTLIHFLAFAIPTGLGLAVGTPMIVAGQVLLVLLDQRAIAAKQYRLAKRIHRALRPAAPEDAAPRRRRRVI